MGQQNVPNLKVFRGQSVCPNLAKGGGMKAASVGKYVGGYILICIILLEREVEDHLEHTFLGQFLVRSLLLFALIWPPKLIRYYGMIIGPNSGSRPPNQTIIESN